MRSGAPPGSGPALADARSEPRPSAIRGGAKLGVLPVALVGTDDAEAHLALGLAEEITSALARFRWIFLVASSSISQFVVESRDDASLRRTLGLDYVLDGSVQRVGKRLRITVRLVDLQDGSQIVWARRFDRQVDDLLMLQDEVAAEVVAQVDPEVLLIESRRAAHRPQQHATAYDLVLRAVPSMTRLERGNFLQAGDLLRQAIARDPEYAAAQAWYAYWLQFLVAQGWSDDVEGSATQASHYAERAITLDAQDARGFAVAGQVRVALFQRLREGMALLDRALALNPNLAMAWALSGQALICLGQRDEGEERLNRDKRLSPMDPGAFHYDVAFCWLALLRRDYEAAVTIGRTVTEMNPAYAGAGRPYLAALVHLGQEREAAVVIRRLLELDPRFSIAGFLASTPFEREEDRLHIAAGLRRAGLTEGTPL